MKYFHIEDEVLLPLLTGIDIFSREKEQQGRASFHVVGPVYMAPWTYSKQLCLHKQIQAVTNHLTYF